MPADTPTVGAGVFLGVLALVLLVPAVGWLYFQPGSAEQATVEGEPTILAEPHDADGDGRAGWIELVLLEDPDRTYEPSTLHVELEPHGGEAIVEHDDPMPYVRDKIVCTATDAQRGVREASRACRTTASGTGGTSWFDAAADWRTGESVYVPCQVVDGVAVERPAGDGAVEGDEEGDGGDGAARRFGEASSPHKIRVSIRSELLLAQTVVCEEAAPLDLVDGTGR